MAVSWQLLVLVSTDPSDASVPDVFLDVEISERRARPVMGLPVLTSNGFPPSSDSEGQTRSEPTAIGVPQQYNEVVPLKNTLVMEEPPFGYDLAGIN